MTKQLITKERGDNKRIQSTTGEAVNHRCSRVITTLAQHSTLDSAALIKRANTVSSPYSLYVNGGKEETGRFCSIVAQSACELLLLAE